MARPRQHLARAPIVEALIDIRVLPYEGVAGAVFKTLANRLKDTYPKASPMRSLETRFELRETKFAAPSQIQTDIGWIFQTQERDAIAQFRVDGFTFNKLEPYTTWEQVFSEAYRLWRFYVEAAKPLDVTRLAVRYINRLRLPAPVQLREYLEAPPVLPAPIPQTIREFLTRVVIVDSERDASAIITQALEANLDATSTPVLLDIDAFREATVVPDDPSMPRIFEQLRRLKNDIFYASITEKTVEMYA
jgi:uncharacterized protein (TIGR04255 family)